MLQTIAGYIIEYSSRGIADGVSRAIRDGSVPPGTKLPSIRRMAEQFQCSPTTVSAAYALLSRAGLIHTDRRRGTVVLDRPRHGRGRYRKALGQTADLAIDLSTGTPDPALLPDLAMALRRLSTSDASGNYLRTQSCLRCTNTCRRRGRSRPTCSRSQMVPWTRSTSS